jgi:hypothetical protein
MEDTEKISEISNLSLNIASKIPKEFITIFSPESRNHTPELKKLLNHWEEGLEKAPSPISPIRKNVVFTQKKYSQAPPIIEGLQTRRQHAKDKKVKINKKK